MHVTYNSAQLWLFLLSSALARHIQPHLPERKSLRPYPYGGCDSELYMCKNQACIRRSDLCDGSNECGDNSDEEYCPNRHYYGPAVCPNHYEFFKCDSRRCIPEIWKCDGHQDCNDQSDEQDCIKGKQYVPGVTNNILKATQWLHTLSEWNLTPIKWTANLPRIIVALYIADTKNFDRHDVKILRISYETRLELLHSILKEKLNVEPLSTSKLALYINALTVLCLDTRNFYRMDLVALLRSQIDRQAHFVNPFALLVLCNAGDTMSNTDVENLFDVFKTPAFSSRTDMRSLALMALTCISKIENGPSVSSSNFSAFVSDLKSKQHENGSFGSLHTTALALQALFASSGGDIDDWHVDAALKYLVQEQKSDGSFGNILTTYYVLFALSGKSLLDVNSEHCSIRSDKKGRIILDSFGDGRNPQQIRVKYSIAYGENITVKYTVMLDVPVNSTLFEVMTWASEIYSNYKFQSIIEDSKPFIYELDGTQNDSEYRRFWILHLLSQETNSTEVIESSPVDVIVQDKQEFLMWYRTPRDSTQHLSTI